MRQILKVLRGILLLLLLVTHTVVMAVPVYAAIAAKLVLPAGSAARRRASLSVAWLAQRWAFTNLALAERFLGLDWRVDRNFEPQAAGRYLVCANHQSWNDILVLVKAFGSRAPFFKFFLKRQLIWIPILGGVWWGLDYPFMYRHTREQIERRPELRGRDIEATRRACAAFAGQPALILNFLEGTRFTPAKHDRQQSPYRHLLRPRAGGIAFALSALGGQLDGFIDVTIVYPDGSGGFWDFLCGRVRRAQICVRQREIPADLCPSAYDTDIGHRLAFQNWVSGIWAHKDQQIDAMLLKR